MSRKPAWADVARARSSARSEVVPAADIRPPGTTQEQVNQTNKRLIDESKPIAAVVAPARRQATRSTSPARAPKSKASSRACPPTACSRSATSSSPSTASRSRRPTRCSTASAATSQAISVTLTIRRDGQTPGRAGRHRQFADRACPAHRRCHGQYVPVRRAHAVPGRHRVRQRRRTLRRASCSRWASSTRSPTAT